MDYQAPEARARNGKTNRSSDIYSFGVMLWEVKKHRSRFTDFPPDLLARVDWDGPSADILRGVAGEHGGALAECEHILIEGRPTRQAQPPGVNEPRRPTARELLAALE